MLGEFDAAIEQLHKALDLDPSFAPGRDLRALSYAFKGSYLQAVAEVDRIAAISGENIRADIRLRGPWGLVCAAVGKQAEARIVLAEMRQCSEKPPDFLYAYYCAAIHALLGEKDEALEWLEKARQGRVFGLFYLKMSPEFKTLHGDVRFGDLLRRMGLPE
jgi:tetratricopeptide (TPR) repeat protein